MLPGQEDVEQGRARLARDPRLENAGISECVDRQRRHPRAKVRVDRPAAVLTNRVDEEVDAAARRGVIDLAARREAHRHERRQRGGFEKATVRRLESLEHPQSPRSSRRAQHASDRVPARTVMKAGLSDADQRGKRVADDGQAYVAKPAVRQRGELERQGANETPCLHRIAEPAGEGRHGEDRDRERAVLPVDSADRRGQTSGLEASDTPRQPLLGAPQRRFVSRATLPVGAESAPAERGRGEVALRPGGVAPSAVDILAQDERLPPAANEARQVGIGGPARRLTGELTLDKVQGEDGGGCRESARRQLPVPATVLGARVHETSDHGIESSGRRHQRLRWPRASRPYHVYSTSRRSSAQ